MIFSTWDQVKTYLRHIAHDPVIDRLNRWYFFNFTGENCIGRGNRNTAAKRTARRKKK
jgi:hypothetical protein